MTALPEAVSLHPSNSPLEAFSGVIARTKTGPLYSAGLAIVAFAMVLLPLLYLALIAFTAWAVLWHLKNDTWIFDGPSGRAGFSQFLMYLGPAVAGGMAEAAQETNPQRVNVLIGQEFHATGLT
jgi:hypothetical protein